MASKCGFDRLEKLAGMVRQRGRVHEDECIAFLRCSPKYWKYDIRPWFVRHYGLVEDNEFLVAAPMEAQA